MTRMKIVTRLPDVTQTPLCSNSSRNFCGDVKDEAQTPSVITTGKFRISLGVPPIPGGGGGDSKGAVPVMAFDDDFCA